MKLPTDSTDTSRTLGMRFRFHESDALAEPARVQLILCDLLLTLVALLSHSEHT